jgi:hypothetical protein
VTLFDRRYRLDRAVVRFDGGVDPMVDVQIRHEFPELTLYAEVRGRLSAPRLALRSEPATYSEGELLGFLLGGSPSSAQGRDTRQVATGVASSLLAKQLAPVLQELLPVQLDVLRYEAADAGSAASFTIGKWLTDQLFLAYKRRLETRPDQNAGEALGEYWFNRNVLFEGTAGDRGIHGADLLWIRRW